MIASGQQSLSNSYISQFAMSRENVRVDIQSIRKRNLLTLISETGSKAELSRQTGVNEAYLSHITSGVRAMGHKVARQLEQGVGRPRGWMDQDHLMLDAPQHNSLPIRWVPEISWVQAGQLNAIEDHYQPGDGRRMVPTTKNVGENAFALRVEGDSMVNPMGRPSYPPGSTIIVDPAKQPNNGDRVVVKEDGAEKATFKQLVIDGKRVYLRALNPHYPTIELTEGMRIVGVVVQTLIDE